MQELESEKKAVLSDWIHEHSQMVLRTAFYFVKDQMVAEDIAQEVFLRVYKKMEEYRGESSVATWLYRVTVNTCKDYLRSWNYRKLVFSQTFLEWKTGESPEQEVIRKLNENELVRKVMALPVKYREVIVLHYFEQLKSREIAELLRLKESTVRVRIKRGIDKLKEELSGGEVHGTNGQIL
nr:sigma-70 family RNA polymerase sigma factor [Effusibacillus pohliae]